MFPGRFFSKKGVKKNAGEFVLWRAGREPAKRMEEKTETIRLFNIPVSPEALPGSGRIYTVQGSVKGDGASTVASNLAGLLALSSPERVVLIDLDGYGTVRSRLGLPAGECLVNILDWEDIHGPRDIARGVLAHSSGIMVIPGVIHYDHVEKVTPDLVFKMLTLLKESYDYIVIDSPPAGMENSAWAAALVSDVILTVFRPDRVSLDLLNENNGFMSRLGCQDRVYTVLNQAGVPGGIRPGDVENKLSLNLIGMLPYSITVAEANNRRQLVVYARQKDNFTRALQLLADKIPDRKRVVS
ncbi:MAG: AAA family ATPase [Bacillota bacterium]